MSNDIPEDEDLRIDLRGFDFADKKKGKEEDDSLIIGNNVELNDIEEPASVLIDDSIDNSISGISDIKPEEILALQMDTGEKEEIYKDHWDGFLLTGVTILVGFMFFGCLLGLDLLIGLNCQEIGCNCGHPFIANAIYELLYGG